MVDTNIAVGNVEVVRFVNMTKIYMSARIVAVDSCARPYTVLPKKKCKFKGRCFFALSICFRVLL